MTDENIHLQKFIDTLLCLAYTNYSIEVRAGKRLRAIGTPMCAKHYLCFTRYIEDLIEKSHPPPSIAITTSMVNKWWKSYNDPTPRLPCSDANFDSAIHSYCNYKWP